VADSEREKEKQTDREKECVHNNIKFSV
jgi:hypothetical protein